ncbi:MAG TPA: hypothetical protein DER32_01120, partial [Deinococcus radiodurans]|nr:hypothetical protein [Deinococcus radiodurans]
MSETGWNINSDSAHRQEGDVPRQLQLWTFDLEQFSELRVRRNSTATRSILRPAPCFVLAPLAKKLCHLFVK